MKPLMTEARFDVRAGLNRKVQPNLLNDNELVLSENVRLETLQGGASRRLGTRRLHAASLGGPVTGLQQWDAPGGKQLVAVADGKLHHKTTYTGAFSSVSPSPVMGSVPAQIMTARENAINAPLRLYVADGALVRRWTGSALSTISNLQNVPPNVDLMVLYNQRAFWRRSDQEQTVYWGVLGDPEDGDAGLGDLGGAAMVDVLRGEGIVAMEVIGSSLVMATPKSVVRFSGYSAADIQIAQDTQGISSEVGCVGPKALLRAEELGIMVSNRDVYLLNESELRPIGVKVKPILMAANRSALQDICVGFHPARREVWVAYRDEGDTAQESVLCYSSELDAWYGPFRYPFGIECFSVFEDENGDEHLLAGCSDGFVRDMDTGFMDDALEDGSGGTRFTGTIEYSPLVFENGPHITKTLRRLNLEHILSEDAEVSIGIATDDEGHFSWRTLQGSTGKLMDTRIDFYAQGKRFNVRLLLEGSGRIDILGFIAEAFHMQRN
jgi:hypothetical protein